MGRSTFGLDYTLSSYPRIKVLLLAMMKILVRLACGGKRQDLYRSHLELACEIYHYRQVVLERYGA